MSNIHLSSRGFKGFYDLLIHTQVMVDESCDKKGERKKVDQATCCLSRCLAYRASYAKGCKEEEPTV